MCKRHLTEEDTHMTNMYIKRCSILLAIRKMEIKTTVRYLYPSIRLAKININENTKHRAGKGAKKLDQAYVADRNVKW